MYLCYLVAVDAIVLNVLNFVILMKKKRFGKTFGTQLHCLFINHTFFTSKQIDPPKKNKRGQKLYDVNVRAIYGFRQVGAGHEHLKKLCCYLNMPGHMLLNNCQNISLKLKESAKRVAEKSVSMAASKLRGDVAMWLSLLTEHGSVKVSHP